MKLIHFLLVAFLTVLPDEIQAELFLIDKVECVVCGPERNTPIVDTDVTLKRNLDGQVVPLQQQIQQDIVSQQIIADKMPIDPAAAEKYVETMKKQNNLTDSDLAELFEQVGRTFTEGLGLLNDQYYHEMFMHHKFKSQVIATDEDVQEYYEQHPQYVDGWCELQVAYIDYNEESRDNVKNSVDKIAQGEKVEGVDIEWSSPMKVQLGDLASDKKFIFDMEKSEVKAHEASGSYELYKLVDKKEPELKSLSDRRASIVDKLNRQQLEKMLENYNQEVRKFVDIINLNDKLVFADN